MAVVYLARDLKHDRPVAFKLLRPEVAAGIDVERFRREIATAARLQHPHICSVYDSGEDEGQLWFTMPFVRGESLRERLRREGRLSIAEALRITREVAQALAYAHREGVVHRDVKPENVLLTEDGVTLVADFGIARPMAAHQTGEHLTEAGHVIGTPTYMAPEQAMGERADHRADQYALAATCYEILAGVPPHAGPTLHAVIAQRLMATAPSVRSHRPEVSAATESALQRALSVEPGDRFDSILDFVRALNEATPARQGAWRVPKAAWAIPAVLLVAAAAVVLPRGKPAAGTPAATPETSGMVRLAVLPFDNLGDSNDAYFAAGVSDEVRGKLAGLADLEVIARGSSIHYVAGGVTSQQIAQIARELDVDYLLTGTVRWVKEAGGSRVRVSPELIDSRTGATRWQQPFDAALTDVFGVQADIAGKVAEALQLALADSTRARLAATPTGNLDAYARYLRSRELRSGEISPEVLRAAIAELQEAVRLDSTFAAAWAELAMVQVDAFRLGGLRFADAEAARGSLSRAVALAPSSSDTRAASGRYQHVVAGDPAAALLEYREGLRVAPNRSDLLSGAGATEMELGRWSEALKNLQHASRVDPRSPDAASTLGVAYLRLRRYPEARGEIDRARLLRPYSLSLAHTRARLAVAEGDLGAARRAYRAVEAVAGVRHVVAYVALREDLIWTLEDDQLRVLVSLTPADLDGGRADWSLAVAQAHHFLGDQVLARAYADSAAMAYGHMLAGWGDRADRGQMTALRALALAHAGRRSEALADAALAGELQPLGSDLQSSYVAYLQARIYLLAGEKEWSIERLEAILAVPDMRSRGWFRIDRTLAGLRGHPEFQKLTSIF